MAARSPNFNQAKKAINTPKSAPFVAPERNMVNAYVSYLTGIDPTDTVRINQFLNSPNLTPTQGVGNNDGNIPGLISVEQASQLYQYRYMDNYYLEYDRKVAENKAEYDRQVAEQKAKTEQTNVLNAQANASQRRIGGPAVRPQTGILGLPLVEYQQTTGKYGF
jgi:hypothetical protein